MVCNGIVPIKTQEVVGHWRTGPNGVPWTNKIARKDNQHVIHPQHAELTTRGNGFSKNWMLVVDEDLPLEKDGRDAAGISQWKIKSQSSMKIFIFSRRLRCHEETPICTVSNGCRAIPGFGASRRLRIMKKCRKGDTWQHLAPSRHKKTISCKPMGRWCALLSNISDDDLLIFSWVDGQPQFVQG